jgi:hypothetical protein
LLLLGVVLISCSNDTESAVIDITLPLLLMIILRLLLKIKSPLYFRKSEKV